jgi:Spy/CpxP family protein refolding chaperone
MFKIFFLSILLLPVPAFAQQHPSAYAGQQSRGIKALSDDEIRGYLSGQGMALAKAGELNHYPGPLHVLEFAEQLKLTDAQKRRTEEIRKTMLDEAIPIGKRIVDKEADLDRLFAAGAIDTAKLDSTLGELGRLQGDLRAAHLRAHLEQKKILTAEQIAKYDELRGYAKAETRAEHREHFGH